MPGRMPLCVWFLFGGGVVGVGGVHGTGRRAQGAATIDSAGVPDSGLVGPHWGLGLHGVLPAVEYDAVHTCSGAAGVIWPPMLMLWDRDHTNNTAACVDSAVPTYGRLPSQLIASAPHACVAPPQMGSWSTMLSLHAAVLLV